MAAQESNRLHRAMDLERLDAARHEEAQVETGIVHDERARPDWLEDGPRHALHVEDADATTAGIELDETDLAAVRVQRALLDQAPGRPLEGPVLSAVADGREARDDLGPGHHLCVVGDQAVVAGVGEDFPDDLAAEAFRDDVGDLDFEVRQGLKASTLQLRRECMFFLGAPKSSDFSVRCVHSVRGLQNQRLS